MPQKEILGWTSSDKFPTLWTEYPVFGFGSRIWEKTVMIKKNDQKRMIKKICPYGFPGIYYSYGMGTYFYLFCRQTPTRFWWKTTSAS